MASYNNTHCKFLCPFMQQGQHYLCTIKSI